MRILNSKLYFYLISKILRIESIYLFLYSIRFLYLLSIKFRKQKKKKIHISRIQEKKKSDKIILLKYLTN